MNDRSTNASFSRPAALAVLILRAAGLGLSYLTIVMASRWGGSAAGAAYSAFVAWIALVAVPLHRGWPQIAIRLGAEQRDNVADLWWHSTRSIIRFALPLALACFGLVAFGPTAGFVGAGALVLAILRIDEGWLRGTHSALRAVLALSALVPATTFAAVIVLHTTVGVTGWRIVICALAGHTAVLVAQRLVYRVRRPDGPQWRPDRATLRSVWTIAISTASGVMIRNADLAVAALVLEPSEVTSYALVSRLGQALSQITFATNAVIAPRLVNDWQRGNRAGAHRRLVDVGRQGGTLAIVSAVGLTAVVPLAFRLSRLDFTDEFKVAFAVLVLGNIVAVMCGPVLMALNVTGGDAAAARIQSVTLVGLACTLVGATLVGHPVGFALAASSWMSFGSLALRRTWAQRVP